MEQLGFEFRRDLEQLVHDGALRSYREAQRVSFRPGVLDSSDPADVYLQQRTKKKLARALRSLRDDYGVSLVQCKEALAYTNSLEDALSFLALQYTSEELPPTLRALPKEALSLRDADDDGELVAEVYVVGKANEVKKVEPKKIGMEENILPKPMDPHKTWDNCHDARSWTQQHVLNMAAREEKMAGRDTDNTREACELLELEKHYRDVLAARHRLQSRKLNTKTKSTVKLKIQEMNNEIQDTRRKLLARGWSDPQMIFIDQSKARVKTVAPAHESSVPTVARNENNLVSLALAQTSEKTEREREEETEQVISLTETVSRDEEESVDGLCGLLEQAEATVVGADELVKSAPLDTAARIATRAAANLATIQTSKGEKKSKKGRNVVKLRAARAQAQKPAAAGTWTGTSPQEQLEQYCLRNGKPKPQYKKLACDSGGKYVYAVAIDTKLGGNHEVTVRRAGVTIEGFDSIAEAKDAVATSALFELASNLPLYRVLPPVYRDMWQTWIKEQQTADAAAAAMDRGAQDELLTEIFNALPPGIATKRALAKPLEKKTEPVLNDWSVDDWDADLSDDDVRIKHTESTREATVAMDELDIEDESDSERKAAVDLSNQLRQALVKRMRSSAYRAKLLQRASLPIALFKQQIVEMLTTFDVILISGETGCGKSTQVPQFLLEDLLLSARGGARGQIVCTQPRRLAAMSLAGRVSEELGEATIGMGDSLTGFQIRLESRITRFTRLLFCTTGILLQKLQDPRTLDEEVSHVIVDEVHERDLQSDVLLAMLRQFLAERNAARRRKFGGTLPRLKVILMSATLNAARFQQYFGGTAVCPMVQVPGRTFPVEQFYLEDVLERTQFVVDDESPPADQSGLDKVSTQVKISGRGGTSYTQQVSWTSTLDSSVTSRQRETETRLAGTYSESTRRALERIDPSVVNYDLIQALLEHVTTETDLLSLASGQSSASVLIFLPGLQEITTLLDVLGGSRLLRHDLHGRDFNLLPLHSSLSAQEQQRIFCQRAGEIRVIAATNIAETSLTIEDVKVVIDTGRVKQMRHDAQHRTNVLEEIWIARANATQRAGRAGRTSGGSCFRLFPASIYRSVMLDQPVPEIQRAPLTSLCLRIKTIRAHGPQKDGCRDFLHACLDPPDDKSIADALDELFEIGALTREDEVLTDLGSHLAQLPVDVKVGKLLLLGALFGVFDAASTCAAVLETKSPFVAPFGRHTDMKRVRQTFAVGASDVLTDVNAFEAWRDIVQLGQSDRVTETTFCQQHFLSARGLRELKELKRQFQRLVAQLDFLPAELPESKRTSREHLALMSALLYASLAPNLVLAEKPPLASGPQRPIFRERDHGLVVMHPSSINYKVVHFHASPFVTYAVKLHTSQVFLPASSVVLPLAVCLFSRKVECLPQLRRKHKDGNETIGMRVDEWVFVRTSFRSASLTLELRHALRTCIASSLRTPPFARSVTAETNRLNEERKTLMNVLRVLFLAEYEERDPTNQLSSHLGKTLVR